MLWKDMKKPVSLEDHAGVTAPAPPARRPDSWVQLPQGPEKGGGGSGYYTYGKMPLGMAGTKADYQWGAPRAMQVIQSVAGHLANGPEYTPFGVGNISLSGGRSSKDHKGHIDGLGIDVRPARNDGREGPGDGLTYGHPAYDRAATKRLINAFLETGQVKAIYFNDPELLKDSELRDHVQWQEKHDDHLHIQLLPD